MKALKQLLKFTWLNDPVNLSLKGKCLAILACFIAIYVIAWVTAAYSAASISPVLIASMGASAIIVFIIPHSPLAQPWPLVGGQMLSALAGVFSAQTFSSMSLAAACAIALSMLLMFMCRCLHPPGAATALTPILAAHSFAPLNYSFIWMPVGINACILLIITLALNRWLLGHTYPAPAVQPASARPNPSNTVDAFTEADLQSALHRKSMYMDVTAADLNSLFSDAQLQNFKRTQSSLCCADIMVRDIRNVEYDTEVEDAWKCLHQHKLHALPVLDRSRRVIGIITWHDFFKFISLDEHTSFKEKFQAFVRRTPQLSTQKPEAVGHIMSRNVSVLVESAHIAELIPLMSFQGHRQIPIINHEQRLVGMVYQANLIDALYQDRQLLTATGE